MSRGSVLQMLPRLNLADRCLSGDDGDREVNKMESGQEKGHSSDSWSGRVQASLTQMIHARFCCHGRCAALDKVASLKPASRLRSEAKCREPIVYGQN